MLNFQDPLTVDPAPRVSKAALTAVKDAPPQETAQNHELMPDKGGDQETLPSAPAIDFETFMSAETEPVSTNNANRNTDERAVTPSRMVNKSSASEGSTLALNFINFEAPTSRLVENDRASVKLEFGVQARQAVDAASPVEAISEPLQKNASHITPDNSSENSPEIMPETLPEMMPEITLDRNGMAMAAVAVRPAPRASAVLAQSVLINEAPAPNAAPKTEGQDTPHFTPHSAAWSAAEPRSQEPPATLEMNTNQPERTDRSIADIRTTDARPSAAAADIANKTAEDDVGENNTPENNVLNTPTAEIGLTPTPEEAPRSALTIENRAGFENALNISSAGTPPQAAAATMMPLEAASEQAATDRTFNMDQTFKTKDHIESQLQSQPLEKHSLKAADLDIADFKALETAAPKDAALRLEPMQSFALAAQAPAPSPVTPTAISSAAPLQTPLDKPAVTALAQTVVKTLETQKGVSIRLDPPEMGRVYIDYQFDRDNTVTALLRADTPEILAQLRDNSAALQEFLKQSGFDAVTLNFEQSRSEQGSAQENEYKDSAITFDDEQDNMSSAAPPAADTLSGRALGLMAASIDIKL